MPTALKVVVHVGDTNSADGTRHVEKQSRCERVRWTRVAVASRVLAPSRNATRSLALGVGLLKFKRLWADMPHHHNFNCDQYDLGCMAELFPVVVSADFTKR